MIAPDLGGCSARCIRAPRHAETNGRMASSRQRLRRLVLAIGASLAALLAAVVLASRNPPTPIDLSPQTLPAPGDTPLRVERPMEFSPTRAAMQPLIDAGLAGDLPIAASLIGRMTDVDPNSPLQLAFDQLLTSPDAAAMTALLDASRNEFIQRSLDSVNGIKSDATDAAEPKRQILIRMLLGEEYARAQGQLSPAESDKALWEMTNITDSYGAEPDLRAIAAQLVESRLTQTRDDEERWSRETPQQRAPDDSPDAALRHWTRGLLDYAMEQAARDGRTATFEDYAARYLALPIDGKPQFEESNRRYYEERVKQFRELLAGK